MVSNGEPANVQSREVQNWQKAKPHFFPISMKMSESAEARLSPGTRDQGQLGNTVMFDLLHLALSPLPPTCPETLIISWTWYNVCLLVRKRDGSHRHIKACRLSQQPWGNRVAVFSYEGMLVGRFTKRCIYSLELLFSYLQYHICHSATTLMGQGEDPRRHTERNSI